MVEELSRIMMTRLCDICGEKWIKGPADVYYMKRKVLAFNKSWSERMDVCSDCMRVIETLIKNYDFHKSTGNFTIKHKYEKEQKKVKWIKISPANIFECPECGQEVMTNDIESYLWCHHCGEDMRK